MASVNPISRMTPEKATRELELISKAEPGTLIEVKEDGHVALIGGFGKFVRWLYSLFTCQDGFADCHMTVIAKHISQLFEKSQEDETQELLPALVGKLLSLRLEKDEMIAARDDLIAKITEINKMHHHPEAFIQEYLSDELRLEEVVVERDHDAPQLFRIFSANWEGEAKMQYVHRIVTPDVFQRVAQSAVFQSLYNAQVGCPMPAGFNGIRTIEKDSFSEPTIQRINAWLATLPRDAGSPAPELQIEGDSYTITHTGIKGQIPFQFRAGSKDTSQILPGPTFFQLQLSICREKLLCEQMSAIIDKALAKFGLEGAFVQSVQAEEPSMMSFEITLPGENQVPVILSFYRDETTGQVPYSDLENEEFAQRFICDHLYGTEKYIQMLPSQKSDEPFHTSYEVCNIEYYEAGLRDVLVVKMNEWLTNIRANGVAVPGEKLELYRNEEGLPCYRILDSDICGEVQFYHPPQEDGECNYSLFYPHLTVIGLFKDICYYTTLRERKEATPA